LIPFVGQAADLRDTIAAFRQVQNGEKGAWVNLFAAGVGWVPGIGDAAKGLIRGGKRTLDAGTEVAQGVARRTGEVVGGGAKGVSGLTQDMAEAAFAGMRNDGGHAIRHLEGTLIPDSGPLQSRVNAFKTLATPILENPIHVADWRIGVTDGRAFLGNVNGQSVVVVVAQNGPYQGKVISSFIPDTNQLKLIFSR